MNKWLCMTVAMAMTAPLFVACGGDDEGGQTPPLAPTIVLKDGDIKATHEIKPGMSVVVNVAAPGGVADFTIRIDSPFLTPEELSALGLAAEMNLVTPATSQMAAGLKGLGFPVGDDVKGKTALTFNISSLIPMIAQLYDQTSDHDFTLTVTDAKAQRTTETLKFHLSGPQTITYNNDADLWANTATLTVKNQPEGTKVQYRVKDAEAWTDAVSADGTVFNIAPVYEASKNEAELDIYTIKAGTGIFAATTYEYRMLDGEKVLDSGEFTTAAGDKIPNGDMSGWSKKQMTTDNTMFFPITYPNAEGQNFWDSGNNMFLEQYDDETGEPTINTPLCSEADGAAHLKAQMVLGFVFAPGNMFTGQFVYTGLNGTVGFGQPYTWTARPRALKVRYKAQIGKIDKVGSNDPDGAAYKDKQDRSCIFMAVVDWKAQHGVTSGMDAPTGMWNPSETTSLTEGPILGYGQQIITETTNGWVELTIPFAWYDKAVANPSGSAFSLVISCATSVRGDYLTGCSTNEMQVDDFEWVY